MKPESYIQLLDWVKNKTPLNINGKKETVKEIYRKHGSVFIFKCSDNSEFTLDEMMEKEFCK